ncbi:MAG: hypothetical protein HKO64_11790 [Xanthomonadales bacterium]|nr:hypothetical protein [Xanthomonadales bacterium]NNL96293.1 hypothetical protein [Xanthomonadales bacterium]
MFWLVAIAVSLVVTLAVCWPLLRTDGLMRSAGLSLVALGILLSLLLYREVGTPSGIGVDGRPVAGSANANHSPDQVEMDQLLQQLVQRLEANPDDLDGWLILGRSYKTMQRYEESLEALANAFRLAPENPLVIVEYAEARMFASGNPQIGSEELLLLQRAVDADPQSQKGLWLLGIAAAQAGQNNEAISYWSRLLEQMESDSAAAVAIKEQIGLLQGQASVTPTPASWDGFDIIVDAPEQQFEAAPGSVLFVIARRPGGGGPPLGVRRIENPRFPVQLQLTDSDSMMPQVPISSVQTVELLARLSMTGQPVPSEGDIESAVKQRAITDSKAVTLGLLID